MLINDDDRPTLAECERDEQHRRRYVPTATELRDWIATEPFTRDDELPEGLRT